MSDYLDKIENKLISKNIEPEPKDKTLQQLSRYPRSFKVLSDNLYLEFELDWDLDINSEGGVNCASYSLNDDWEMDNKKLRKGLEERVPSLDPEEMKEHLSENIHVKEERFDGKEQEKLHETNLKSLIGSKIYEVVFNREPVTKISSIPITSQRLLWEGKDEDVSPGVKYSGYQSNSNLF
jgi:hypothetical protein